MHISNIKPFVYYLVKISCTLNNGLRGKGCYTFLRHSGVGSLPKTSFELWSWTTGYNRSTSDVREVSQRSHWKCIMDVPILGKM